MLMSSQFKNFIEQKDLEMRIQKGEVGNENNAEFKLEILALSIIMFRITEVRYKRVYGCRKKRLKTATFF
jgi:hypothetical protein